MFTNQSAELSLEESCRIVTAVRGERVHPLWVTASSNHNTGTLHRIRFHPDVNELTADARWEMEFAVGAMESSPTDPTLLLTAPEQGSAATLWRLPCSGHDSDSDHAWTDLSQSAASQQPEQVTSLLPEGGFGANIVDLAWRGSNQDHAGDMGETSSTSGGGDVLTLDQNGHLTQWDIAAEASVRAVDTLLSEATASTTANYYIPPRVAWDPHGDAVAVTCQQTGVGILDWRTNVTIPTGTVSRIRHAHRGGVTALDYNPNQPYSLATGGQDGLAKVWDLRQTKHPVLTARGGHSHWICRVQYNPFHDPLVLTTGTDGVANLWRWSTVSSAPLLVSRGGGGDDPHEGDSAAPNVRVARYEHGDSCYAAAWGATDAWIYLTVGYDGKVVLQHVPSKEKYKILL